MAKAVPTAGTAVRNSRLVVIVGSRWRMSRAANGEKPAGHKRLLQANCARPRVREFDVCKEPDGELLHEKATGNP